MHFAIKTFTDFQTKILSNNEKKGTQSHEKRDLVPTSGPLLNSSLYTTTLQAIVMEIKFWPVYM